MPQITNNSKKVFRPFDNVYRDVTENMERLRGSQRDANLRQWLKNLIDGFKSERNKWDQNVDIFPYTIIASQLKFKYLKFAAGAYLHISYDLPRVIADFFPDRNPGKIGGRKLYIDTMVLYRNIGGVFPEISRNAVRDKEVMGVFSYIYFVLNAFGFNHLSDLWMRDARLTAWYNADLLKQQNPRLRPYSEKIMLKAMTQALKDTCDLNPWAVTNFQPPAGAGLLSIPDFIAISMIANIAVTAAMIPDNYLIIIIIILALMIVSLLKIHRIVKNLRRFVYDLGTLSRDYVAIAISDPEGFEQFVSEYRPLASTLETYR
jgi:hypothetical protein